MLQPRTTANALVLLVLCGAALRVHSVLRPFDAQTLTAWREADYTLVARAFFREDMNVLAPRVAWRGDTSGKAEMEFPFVPWTAALLYHACGEREMVLRWLTAAASAADLAVFALLARRLLSPGGACAAVALYVVNPIGFALAGGMQPEALTFLFVNATIERLTAWRAARTAGPFIAAAGLAAAAVLAKGTALYVWPLLAWHVFRIEGTAALRRPLMWAAAALALIPPLAWYWHAHQLYLETGLSLGVSNESHTLNLDLLRHPRDWVTGNLRSELSYVWAGAGFLLAASGLAGADGRRRAETPLVWYGAVCCVYVLAANTSGDGWAFYYHGHSVAPACLLMGLGFSVLQAASRQELRWSGAGLVAAALVVNLAVGARLLVQRFHQPALQAMQMAMRDLRPALPPEARIIVRGGHDRDWTGRPVAYNESMAFVWLDRFGVNYPQEAFSLEAVADLAGGSGAYWVAGPADLKDAAIRAEAERRFERVAESGAWVLFRIPPGH